jgi:O-antigen/teichoic acid export membrane protein
VTLLRNGLLLGVVLFLVTCSGSIPRVALEHWAGPAALGAFATLTVFQQAGNLVASSYGQSLLPRLRQAPLGTIAFWVSVPSLWAIAALLPAYVLRDAIVEFIMPNAPSGISEVFLALTLAQVLAWPAAVIGCALTAKRLYRPQIYVAVLSAAASAIAASLLVPPFAALGAVATLALASATTLLCGFVLLASHESVKAIS